MHILAVQDSAVFNWVWLPLLIFFARVSDVSLGTLRVILVAKGNRIVAPILGFFEVTIWLLAMSQILANIKNPASYLAYGLGFATGTYIGIRIEEWLSLGTVMVRIVTKPSSNGLVGEMRKAGFGVSLVDVEGMSGASKMLFTATHRKNLSRLMQIINEHSPNSFLTIEEIKTAKQGYFRSASGSGQALALGSFRDADGRK